MTYTPQHIANFFLEKSEEEMRNISQMKLQKLVYIAFGWNLAVNGRKLFNEKIEAWDHGPVIPSIYHEFKHFGSSNIDERSISFDMDSLVEVEPNIDRDDSDTVLVLNYVWESYKKFSSAALRRKTHEPDTPWSRVYKPNVRGIALKEKDIKEHFDERIWDYLENSEGEERKIAS